MSNLPRLDRFGLPEGLIAAISCALLLIGSFVAASAATPMPPAERWAALTTFTLIALAYTLQGSAAIADWLGQVVRRDWRPLAALLGLIPALYGAYSVSVGEFTWAGLISSALLAGLPAVALLRGQGARAPLLTDLIGLGYLWLSLELGLLPALALPQQGGLVGFFPLLAVPLLLLLLAARGWPGLGFTWFLSRADLRAALLAAVALVAASLPLALALGLPIGPAAPTGVAAQLGAALAAYFYTALPAELLLRGAAQNGIARALAYHLPPESPLRRAAVPVSVGVSALLAALIQLRHAPGGWPGALLAALIALGAGWVYHRTGKVTAAAVPHALVAWIVGLG